MRIESARADGPAFYVCRHLDGVVEARYLFRAANANAEAERFPAVDFPAFVAALGASARRLHDAGCWHRDLTGGNLLVRFGADGRPGDLYLVDLNRARLGRPPSVSERLRDLSRLALFRPEHQELLLASYWGAPPTGPPAPASTSPATTASCWKNDAEAGARGARDRLKRLLLPRGTHAHIPAAPAGPGCATRRSGTTSRTSRTSTRAARQAAGAPRRPPRPRRGGVGGRRGAAADLAALPGAEGAPPRRAGRFLRAGVCVRPGRRAPGAARPDRGARRPPRAAAPPPLGGGPRAAEEELARALHARGLEVTFALPQNRDLVRDPAAGAGRWRRSPPASPPTAATSRSGRRSTAASGGWNVREYVELARAAEAVFRRLPGVELLGPAVIDFEYHVTAAVLNLRQPGFRFDAVSSLLYVDRRGAPETVRRGSTPWTRCCCCGRSPRPAARRAGRALLDHRGQLAAARGAAFAGRPRRGGRRRAQADYLVRYYLLTLGTGLVERVFWWQLVARGYGLVDPTNPASPRLRPAFHALKTMVRELDGARLLAVLPAPPLARLYHFRRPAGTEVVVGWSTSDSPAPVTLRGPRWWWGRDGEKMAAPTGPSGGERVAEVFPAGRPGGYAPDEAPEGGSSRTGRPASAAGET